MYVLTHTHHHMLFLVVDVDMRSKELKTSTFTLMLIPRLSVSQPMFLSVVHYPTRKSLPAPRILSLEHPALSTSIQLGVSQCQLIELGCGISRILHHNLLWQHI